MHGRCLKHFNFPLGNAIKYIWRAGHKETETAVDDLEKAKYYIQVEIDRLKKTMKHRRSCTPLNKHDPLSNKWRKRGMAKSNYRHLEHRLKNFLSEIL